MSSETTPAAHADGATLVAVAEGDPEKQPSDAQLAHIFSCEQCSANVRELRFGLRGLQAGDEQLASLGGGLDELADHAVASGPGAPSEAEKRGRRLLLVMAILGVAVLAGMFLLPRFVAGFVP